VFLSSLKEGLMPKYRGKRGHISTPRPNYPQCPINQNKGVVVPPKEVATENEETTRERVRAGARARKQAFVIACLAILSWIGLWFLCCIANWISGNRLDPKNQYCFQCTTPKVVQKQIRIEPPPIVSKQPDRFFTIGSTMNEVRLAQGEPFKTSIWGIDIGDGRKRELWCYGKNYFPAIVYFIDGKVARWKGNHQSPLRARIVPGGPVESCLQHFTVGSTRDEVLFVQGQPLAVHFRESTTFKQSEEERLMVQPATVSSWVYGYSWPDRFSEVFFRNDKVTHWTMADVALKVKP